MTSKTSAPKPLPATRLAIKFPWYVVTSVAKTLLEAGRVSKFSVSQSYKITKTPWYLPTAGSPNETKFHLKNSPISLVNKQSGYADGTLYTT